MRQDGPELLTAIRLVILQKRTETSNPIFDPVRTQRIPVGCGVDRQYRFSEPELGYWRQVGEGEVSTDLQNCLDLRVVEALNRDGGIIMLNLAPPELMDEVYDELLANTSEHDREAGGDILWPAGNKTIGGLAGISPTYVERLVLHPKMLEIADAILKPHDPMSPRPPGVDVPEADNVWPYTSFRRMEVIEDGHGGQQLRAHGTGDELSLIHI